MVGEIMPKDYYYYFFLLAYSLHFPQKSKINNLSVITNLNHEYSKEYKSIYFLNYYM